MINIIVKPIDSVPRSEYEQIPKTLRIFVQKQSRNFQYILKV